MNTASLRVAQGFDAPTTTVAPILLLVFLGLLVMALGEAFGGADENARRLGRIGILISSVAGLMFSSIIYVIGWMIRWLLTDVKATVFSDLSRTR